VDEHRTIMGRDETKVYEVEAQEATRRLTASPWGAFVQHTAAQKSWRGKGKGSVSRFLSCGHRELTIKELCERGRKGVRHHYHEGKPRKGVRREQCGKKRVSHKIAVREDSSRLGK